jgi:SAM-dependent methyltransferase
MSDLVDSCEQRTGTLSGKTVLDIGCNDGSLLNFFRSKGCKTVGVEPTGAAVEAKAASHNIIHGFFDKDTANQVLEVFGQPDIITFTNVFAHIENLDELLSNLKLLIGANTVLVIENHYLGAVLKTGQFDTFYHEHPRTYSYRSFKKIAERLSLKLLDVQFVSRYGGNIRVFIGAGHDGGVGPDENNFGSLFNDMTNDVVTWRKQAGEMIARLVRENGPLRAKAFPGRAAVLIKLLELSTEQISAVYEIKDSIKVQHYVPGTRIPILPEAELFSSKDLTKPILNLAWHLAAEVRANLQANGYKGPVIDIKVMHQ